jgi:hypothetical protein
MLDPINLRLTKGLCCTTAEWRSFVGYSNTGRPTPKRPA